MIRKASVHSLNNNALMAVLYLEEYVKGSTKNMCRSVNPKPRPSEDKDVSECYIVGVIMSLKMYVEVTSDE